MSSVTIDRASKISSGLSRWGLIFIDLLRLFAAVFVVLYHYSTANIWPDISALGTRAALNVPAAEFAGLLPYAVAGWIGVQIFFVISGFIIAKSAEDRTAIEFARNRARRLFPIIGITTAIALIVSILYSNEPIWYLVLLALKQIFIIPKGPWLDGVFWTITIEVVFYCGIFFVLYINAFDRVERIVTIWAWGTAALLIALFLAAHLDSDHAGQIIRFERSYVLRFLLISTAPYFCVGYIMHFIFAKGGSLSRYAALAASYIAGLCDIHLQTITSPIYAQTDFDTAAPLVVWSLCVAGIYLTMKIRSDEGPAPALQRLARVLGLMTFPLYLIHNTFGTYMLGVLLRSGMEGYAAIAATVLLCLFVSYLIVFVAEPGLVRFVLGFRSAILALMRKRERLTSLFWMMAARERVALKEAETFPRSGGPAPSRRHVAPW